jgi:D-3-phosphoglycerate dehydrogenase
MLRSDSRLIADDFAAATNLRVVVKQGVGVDNIDLAAAKAAGVAVHNTPALNSESVAEFSLALALSLSRRVTEIDRRVRKGEKVVRSEILGLSLFRKTVGVVGMGNIGRAAARKWIGACEARIVAYDPVAPPDVWDKDQIAHTRVDSLDELLRESDVVTLHVPLLDSTRGMIGPRELGSMKDRSILINASRGGIVDEKALLEELRKRRIWGAVLDAVGVEPPTLEAYGEFLELDNVIITPHIGASTIENQSNSGLAVVRTLLAVLEGKQDVPGKLV